MKPKQRQAADLGDVAPDWLPRLKAANLSPSTISSYRSVAEELLGYLRQQGMPTAAEAITREYIESYLVHLAERSNRPTGKPISPAHVAKHFRSLQQLFRWLDETEGEIAENPITKMRPPAVPEQPVPVLTEEQLAALLATTKGSSFEYRRDAALLRFFIDTGARIGEVAPLTVDALDFDADVAHVFGKGRRARAVPFGAKTGEALRRYLRTRAKHPYADRDALWLGKKGPLAEYGMRQVIRRRGADADRGSTSAHVPA